MSFTQTQGFKMALVLISIDAVLILFHVLHKVPWFEVAVPFFQHHIFSIAQDRGLAEMWQYIKELALVGITLTLGIRYSKIYFSWAALFTYFFLDDAFRIHETVGRFIAQLFEWVPMFYLAAKDFGELSVYAMVGLVFFGLLYFSLKHTSKNHHREVVVLLKLLGVFAVFGVFFDMFAVVVYRMTGWGIVTVLLELIEEGGEMIVLSALTAYTLYVLLHSTALKQKQ